MRQLLTTLFAFLIVIGMASCAIGMSGCANLPANPTPSDIQKAQDSISTQYLAYVLITRPVIAELKGDKQVKALAADVIVRDAFKTALADAAAGHNVNLTELIDIAVRSEDVILGLQSPPTTQPY